MAGNPKPLKESFEKAFPGGLTQSQLWAIVLFAKYVRLRARNNSAFNNLGNFVFPYARFSEVTKKKIVRGVEETYKGLRIDVEGEQTVDVDESDE